jgi:hypothetical protein
MQYRISSIDSDSTSRLINKMLVKLLTSLLLVTIALQQTSLLQMSLFRLKKYFGIDQFNPGLNDLGDDKDIRVGRWASTFYRGEWQSQTPQQFGFISKSSGPVLMLFGDSYDARNTLEFFFEIFETEYAEDKFIFSTNSLNITTDKQTTITDTRANYAYKIDRVFALMGNQNCTMAMTLNFQDKNGKPVEIRSDDLDNILITGSVISEDCGINFTFKVAPLSIEFLKISLLTILAIGFIFLGSYPLYAAIRDRNFNSVMLLGDETLLFSAMTDVVLLVVNMSVATRMMIEYFEFLTLIAMFLVISILFKIRFLQVIFEIRVAENALNEHDAAKRKFVFYLKSVIVFIVLSVGACFSIYYYHLNYVLFLYPIFQIWYNCFHVLRRHNYFHWSLHLQIIIPQLFYPIAMRTAPGNIFRLHTDYSFALILLTIVLVQLGVMFCQKYFGVFFFLPKALRPNSFNYFKKLKGLQGAENVNCPICFIPLTENPEQTQNLQSQLTLKKYMETPCKHAFHELCLQKWMDQKMVCPCCRAKIPPF